MGEEAISASVRVLAVSRVTPASPPPAENAGHVKLSFLDAPWVPMSPVQHVFLYDLGGSAEYSAAVRQLKESLATTLALYLPFAGTLSYDEQTGDVVIDCSDAGVAVFEAEEDGDGYSLDLRRLVMDKAHDVPAFLSQLVPEHDARVLPAPVAAVQVTRLSGGAWLALGVSMLHAVADGLTALRFYNAWASAARGTGSLLAPPHYGREAIVHPRGDEIARNILRSLAPNLPVVAAAEDTDLSEERLARWTFNFSADDIQSLKRRIAAMDEAAELWHNKPVSTFVALAALAWTAFVRSKGFAMGDDTYLVFFADLRKRLHPPVDECYLGNCVKGCLATMDAGELLAEAGLVRASQAIKAAVMEMETAPLDGTELSREQLTRLPVERMVNLAQGPQFKIYEATDFGFGRPRRVELVSTYRDGQIILRGGRHAGEVQLSVGLDEACIDAFQAHIKAYL